MVDTTLDVPCSTSEDTQTDPVTDTRTTAPPEKIAAAEKYSRLGPEEVAQILRIRRLNPDATLAEIAAVLGRSVSTVHYWLAGFTDTTEDARNVLQSDALPAALLLGEMMRTAKQDKVRLDAVKANLSANKLLGNEQAQVHVGVQVVLGGPSLLVATGGAVSD